MNLPIESPFRQSNQRINIKALTEINQNYQNLKHMTNSFKMSRFKGPRNQNKETSLLNFSHLNMQKKTMNTKSINRKNGGWVTVSINNDGSKRLQSAKQQMLVSMQKHDYTKQKQIKQHLHQIFQIGQQINQNFYNYKNIQSKLKQLNKKIKQLKSSTCEFYCYVISGLILYQYSSLTLTIFYFDKALKTLSSIKKTKAFNHLHQLMVYKYSSKVFLQINSLKQARDLAYMYLRKTWRYFNLDEEMNAYDLLGQISLEEGNIEMSRYFHWRMCHAIRQSKEIVQMSNQELAKAEKTQHQLNSYEDITSFLKNQQGITDILINHFRAEAEEQAKGFTSRWKNKQIYLYTHRSSNRVLRNHRSLQRRLIDEKQSKQLHFIRPRDIKKLRKFITQFNRFIFALKRQWDIQILTQQIENINAMTI